MCIFRRPHTVTMDMKLVPMHVLCLCLIPVFLISASEAQQPEEEFRALWMATVINMDWPSHRFLSPAEQQGELLSYLDTMADLNMNALMFQVRPVGDAFYQSELEPWSKYLTGSQGQAPSPLYDPLQYIIEEAHNRSIEVHAWLNPYRANYRPDWEGLAPNHMANIYREHAHVYSNFLWMDPGAAVVVDRLSDVTMDIINRYDVDGIVMDDYFYPYPDAEDTPFPDNITWTDYINGGGNLSRDDWRRDNVNRMIERLYNEISSSEKRVKFGISPFGLHRPGHPEGMPPPIEGLDPYTRLYADTKLWLQQGWMDYLAPQIYWEIDPPSQSYPVILEWWLQEDVNPYGRHVYAANGMYKMRQPWDWSPTEIIRQVNISRELQSQYSMGNVLFNANITRDNFKEINDILKAEVYTDTVRIPDMPWLDEI